MKQKICVIGAGISGISIAKMLADEATVSVYEQRKNIGGLVHCERVNGILYHKVGGHVFNSRNEKVLEWFWSFFDKENEFLKARRRAKVLLNDNFIGYPIENHLFQLKKETVAKIIADLLMTGPAVPSDNFETFLINNFGRTLYYIYFKPYNKKIWGVDLSEVPLEWLEGKLPMPDINSIFLNNILRQEEAEMVHSFFYYPKNGGSQFIIERLAESLSIIRNTAVNRISGSNNSLKVNGTGQLDKVIYTGDIRKLPSYLNDFIDLSDYKDRLTSLRSNGTTNVLCECDPNDLSWLYIPEEKYKAHRIIYTGNFSAVNNAPDGRSSCTVEFSNYLDKEEAIAELKKLPGNLSFISYNYEPNSYVIQNADTRTLIDEIKDILAGKNIFLLGRFAEWEYYNMDKCIESAMLLAKKLI